MVDNILLASLNDVKTFLELDDSNFDNILKLILVGVSNKIANFLNREFLKKERTEYFNGGKIKVYLSAFPIDMTHTITVIDNDELLYLGEDYFVWENEGIISFYTVRPALEPKQLVVTYTGGFDSLGTISVRNKTYDIVDVPDAIMLATVKQTAYEFSRRKEIGITSFSSPEGSINIPSYDLLPEVKNAILPFKKLPSDR